MIPHGVAKIRLTLTTLSKNMVTISIRILSGTIESLKFILRLCSKCECHRQMLQVFKVSEVIPHIQSS